MKYFRCEIFHRAFLSVGRRIAEIGENFKKLCLGSLNVSATVSVRVSGKIS